MGTQPIRDVDWTAARNIRRELESDTKDALIAAARSVFSAKGYGTATIADITAAANVSRPTFYVYFATKAEIFRVVAAHLRDDFLNAHHHPRSVADDPVLLSRASVEAFMDLYYENLELLQEIHNRAEVDQHVASLYEDMVGKPLRRTRRHIERLRAAGTAVPQVEDEYVAVLMRAINIDSARQMREHPELRSFFIDQATRAYLAMIGYTGDRSMLSLERTEQSPADEQVLD
jgi:AcrR family transcriptional regulator